MPFWSFRKIILTKSKCYLKGPNCRLPSWYQNTRCFLEKAVLTDLCQRGSWSCWIWNCSPFISDDSNLCARVCVPIYTLHIYVYKNTLIFFIYIYKWYVLFVWSIIYRTFTWQCVFCFLLPINTAISGTLSHLLLEIFRKSFVFASCSEF